MVQAAHHQFSFADYVQAAEDSGIKLEFLDGQVWAMAGGTPAHAAIAANVIISVGAQLAGKNCRAYTSDLRIRVKATGLGTYPDVSIICGDVELDPEDHKKLTATNPIVLVEVLSPSTEKYDRGAKLQHYQQIESLQEIVLVAHDRHEIEVVRRGKDGAWTTDKAANGGAVKLTSLGAVLQVDDIYR